MGPCNRLSRGLVTTFALLTVLAACKGRDASRILADDVPSTDPVLSVEELPDETLFKAVSKDAGGLIKGGRIVKFLIDNRVPAEPRVFFINANFQVNGQTPDYAKYHYNFAKKKLNVPEPLPEFNEKTYFSEDKRYMAGSLQTYKLEGDNIVYGVSFYPQDVIHGLAAFDATKLISEKVTIPGARFAFVEAGSQQGTEDVANLFAEASIERLSVEKILGQAKYIPMNQGEAWGYLRIFPPNQDEITAKDIVVFDDLPLDLTVVAGTMTRAFQDSNSHVNLKSKERGTPNAVLRDAGPEHPGLTDWANKPIHLKIGPEGFTIEAATPEAVDAKLAERMNRPWVSLVWETATKPVSYDAMCPGTDPAECLKLGKRFGTKASNLGFLQHKEVLGRKNVAGTLSAKLEYDLVPIGFGIPLSYYTDFVNYAPNAVLRDKISQLVAQEKAGTLSSAAKVAMIKEVQGLFYKGKYPPGNLTKIKKKMAAVLPDIEKVKIRSSANAEDIDGFDGAGLHDSYSAKPGTPDLTDESCTREGGTEDGGEGDAKMEPRSIACAIKGVYASLWNKRAVEERSFARIEHSSVAMGISVLPAYDYQAKIAGNSVVVTRVINTSDVFGYTISVQKKNNLVTNPDPGTYSEVTIAALGEGTEPTSLTVTRFAKPKADKPPMTTSVLDREYMLVMVDLSKRVEEAYCRAKPTYYPGGDCRFVSLDVEKPKSLDFEMKFLETKQFVVKQVREFSGK